MIRPRAGDFVWTAAEVAAMEAEIALLRAAGARGVVIGASLPDGRLDAATLARLLRAAEGLDVTLHRAVDLAPDPEEAVALPSRSASRASSRRAAPRGRPTAWRASGGCSRRGRPADDHAGRRRLAGDAAGARAPAADGGSCLLLGAPAAGFGCGGGVRLPAARRTAHRRRPRGGDAGGARRAGVKGRPGRMERRRGSTSAPDRAAKAAAGPEFEAGRYPSGR